MTLHELLDRVEHWKRGRPEAEVVQFVEELFSRYLEACEDDRVPIRQAVRANQELWARAGMTFPILATDETQMKHR
jgi:hypothetical protein